MQLRSVLDWCGSYLNRKFAQQPLDIVRVGKPISVGFACELFSQYKEFAVLCNRMVELTLVESLSGFAGDGSGSWLREKQRSNALYYDCPVLQPTPRVIIKAWQALTVDKPTRFSESSKLFADDNVLVINVGWTLEHIIWGRIRVLNVVSVSARELAESRSKCCYSPPDYLVCEEENGRLNSQIIDTSLTRGYSFTGTEEQRQQALELSGRLGLNKDNYSSDRNYQVKLYQLLGRFPYREDKEYAIIDQIGHPDVARARREALDTVLDGMPVSEFAHLTKSADGELVRQKIAQLLSA